MTALPCGCVLLFNDTPVVINDVDMSRMVRNVSGMTRCAAHQAVWDTAVQKMVDSIDDEFLERMVFPDG